MGCWSLPLLFLEFKENETTTYQNLWDTIKAVVGGKLKALSVSKEKLKRAYTSSLTAHLKALELKEANTPKINRWQEVIKLRAEINKIKNKTKQNKTKTKTNKQTNKNTPKNQQNQELLLWENQQDRKTLSQTKQRVQR